MTSCWTRFPGANNCVTNNICRPKLQYERKFPEAIIIGAKKCGTTVLRKILQYHPLIVTAEKEVSFFNNRTKYEKLGVDWYIQQMPFSTNCQLTIEKSPSYFISKQAPKRLNESMPEAGVKLLLILCNPLIRSV